VDGKRGLTPTYPKDPAAAHVKMENTRAAMPLSILKENILRFL
jgi:hypothetical protein